MTPNGADANDNADAGLRPGIDPRFEATFTLGNRMARILWSVAWTVLAGWTPRPLHGWRSLVLRLFGARVGAGAHIYAGVKVWAPWNLNIGARAGIADGVTLYSMAAITIGADAVLSQGAHLCAGTHDYSDPLFRLVARPITIGARSWICAEAFVGPGVTVGEGAVLGARAVAFRDLAPWTIHTGNPAVLIKPRVLRTSEH